MSSWPLILASRSVDKICSAAWLLAPQPMIARNKAQTKVVMPVKVVAGLSCRVMWRTQPKNHLSKSIWVCALLHQPSAVAYVHRFSSSGELELFLDSLRTVEDGVASHTLGGAEEGFPQQRLVDSRRLLLYSLCVAAAAVSTVQFIFILDQWIPREVRGACLQNFTVCF